MNRAAATLALLAAFAGGETLGLANGVDGVLVVSAHAQSASSGMRPMTRPAAGGPGGAVRPRPVMRPRPMTRPRPSVGMTRPSFNQGQGVRPRPLRPRPSVGMTRPIFNHGQGIRPRPVRPRPSVGTTRPIFNDGQGVRPIEVRPSPGNRPDNRPNPYPQYPDFVDTPEIIDDLRPYYPPSTRPPHYRPPHHYWGDWYWYGGIGWYHRYRRAGLSIVIVNDLPLGCDTRVRRNGKVHYVCGDHYYTSTIVHGERVYEVLTANEDTAANLPVLRLTRPYTQGPDVTELQRLLIRRGYDVDTIDGVFGRATERALKLFQTEMDLDPSGAADAATMKALR